eukprot:TRINITY_DN4372_c0_g1_i1.p1 TRINITY_DN4372_c0_g1~~TRINITY_DN4372_c0_g1_i1.p1  ORF type:complete len:530 (+),score=119.04 TRINITY_DN4372_c0_g1_i1:80-1669(+)
MCAGSGGDGVAPAVNEGAAMHRYVDVTFLLKRAETHHGEHIRLVGSGLALGNWNPDSSVEMTSGPAVYPSWSTTVSFPLPDETCTVDEAGVPVTFEIEYKYIRDRNTHGGGFNWENVENRRISVHAGRAWQVCDDGFDSPGSAGVLERASVPSGHHGHVPFEAVYDFVGEEALGFGAFGVVWRCRGIHRTARGCEDVIETPEDVAVKRIERERLNPRDVRNLFGYRGREGEMQLHALQDHPHIVKLLEVYDSPKVLSLVLELCEGGDLFQTVTSKWQATGTGISEEGAAVVLGHMLDALAFLHDQRIVHRDVKCENVLLSWADVPVEHNICKLCDFGLSARLPESGELRTLLGSAATAAPELLNGKPYGAPVDVWAAGVLLYASLSGAMPFEGESSREIADRVRKGEYSLKSGAWDRISKGAKNCVRTLLRTDVAKRPSAEIAMEDKWVRSFGKTEPNEPKRNVRGAAGDKKPTAIVPTTGDKKPRPKSSGVCCGAGVARLCQRKSTARAKGGSTAAPAGAVAQGGSEA